MKTLIISLFLTLSSAHAYTSWTAMNPWEVCKNKGGIKLQLMVNSGAGFMEFHRFDKDFVSCREENGKMILDMNLYHKSANNMEAGMMMSKRLRLPLGFCDKRPEVIRFNYHADPAIVKNGKFSGPRTVDVKPACSKEF